MPAATKIRITDTANRRRWTRLVSPIAGALIVLVATSCSGGDGDTAGTTAAPRSSTTVPATTTPPTSTTTSSTTTSTTVPAPPVVAAFYDFSTGGTEAAVTLFEDGSFDDRVTEPTTGTWTREGAAYSLSSDDGAAYTVTVDESGESATYQRDALSIILLPLTVSADRLDFAGSTVTPLLEKTPVVFRLTPDGSYEGFVFLPTVGTRVISTGTWVAEGSVITLTDSATGGATVTEATTTGGLTFAGNWPVGSLEARDIVVQASNASAEAFLGTEIESGDAAPSGSSATTVPAEPEELLVYSAPATPLDDVFRHEALPVATGEVPTDQRGAIEKVTYETFAYDYYTDHDVDEDLWEPFVKDAYVYLPAGYDESKQYNVYYALHGAGGNELQMFFGGPEGEAGDGPLAPWLDHAIMDGLIEPLIVVTPTTNLVDATDMPGIEPTKWTNSYELTNFASEMREDLIPAVESKYATYAVSTAPADLVASRDHRAVTGFSQGATVVYNSIVGLNEVVSYYAPIANGISTTGERGRISGSRCRRLGGTRQPARRTVRHRLPLRTVRHRRRNLQRSGGDATAAR